MTVNLQSVFGQLESSVIDENAQPFGRPQAPPVSASEAHEALDRLSALLEEERLALRRLDAAAVLSIANQKESILTTLSAEGVLAMPGVRDRLRAFVVHLRHNGVLLAQARDVVRDALRTGRAELELGRLPTDPPRVPKGMRISTRG